MGDSTLSQEVKPTTAAKRNAVLLLEDNEVIASMLTALMQTLSLRVIWCADGQSALRMFSERRDEVLLVLADCRLPDTDGREVCARLRLTAPNLPVLVTSGSVSGRGVAPLERNNLVEYLPKPYAPAEVLSRVRRLMSVALDDKAWQAGMN